MRAIRLSLLCAAAAIALSPASAQRQTAVGPGPIPLDANGVLGGVDMSGSATTGTLVVGVVGGPAMDIFTLNNPVVAGRVAVSTAASSQGNITFNSGSTVYGAIGQTQPAGPFLLAIAGGNAGSAVNFMGPVFATTTNVSGTGRLNFNSGSTNVSASNFAGDGTLSLAPNTTLIGALTTTAGAQTGTLLLGGGSVLNGAVGGAVGLKAINVVGGGDAAGVTATISGAVDAFSFALGTNTLNIGGALTIANIGTAGVISTTLASPSVYGNIRPVGATNLGPSLLINVTVSPTALIAVGSQFNIVQTQAGTVQSGTNGSVVAISVQNPTNPLYTFRAIPAAGTIAGLVTIEATGIPILAAITPPVGAVVPPVQPIAAVVVPVIVAVAPTPDIVAVLAPINALTTPAAVVTAVAQLAPSPTDGAAALVTFDTTRQLQNLWLTRLDNIGCDQVRPTDEQSDISTPVCRRPDHEGGFWAQGFGYFAKQQSQGAVSGYNANIGGGMLAWDAALGQNTHAGFGVGYVSSNIRARDVSARTNIDTYQVTGYFGHEPGPWFFNAALSISANDYTSKRQIAFPGVNREATSSYNGETYTAFATTGWHLVAGGVTITPLASLQFSRVKLDGYTETGAGDINLTVVPRRYDFIESAAGLKLARNILTSGGVVTPEVHGKWLRELGNPRLQQVAMFVVPGSQSFSVPGIAASDNLFNAGGSLSIASGGRSSRPWTLEAGYDYYTTGKGYVAHQGTIKLAARF